MGVGFNQLIRNSYCPDRLSHRMLPVLYGRHYMRRVEMRWERKMIEERRGRMVSIIMGRMMLESETRKEEIRGSRFWEHGKTESDLDLLIEKKEDEP